MNEKDFLQKLDEINNNIIGVKDTLKLRFWKSFLEGVLRGFGSIIGIILALALLGWILNIAGVIPAFRESVGEWQDLLDRASKQVPAPGANYLNR